MENQNAAVNTEENIPPKKNNTLFLIALLIIIAGGAYWFWNSEQQKKAAALKSTEMPPMSVSVMKVKKTDVPITFEYTGRTAGYKDAEIRAQVSGVLMSKSYKEGQRVRAGQVLFRIDAAPYRATLSRNNANLKQSEVQMNLAKIEYDRVSSLYKKNAVSKAEFDSAEAQYNAAAANRDAAKAAVRQAQIDLNWTTVRAPISGLSSKEELSVGNLISVGEIMTKIIQPDPLYVDFSIPADEHRIIENFKNTGAIVTDKKGISVKIALADGTFHNVEGKINFQDQFVDPSTATIKTRAVFDNKNNSLYPGQFVRLYLTGYSVKNVAEIPLRATLQTSNATIVYVLDSKNMPMSRAITIIQQVDNNCLVGKGLENGDVIITDGVAKVMPGKAVKVIDAPKPESTSEDKSETAHTSNDAEKN